MTKDDLRELALTEAALNEVIEYAERVEDEANNARRCPSCQTALIPVEEWRTAQVILAIVPEYRRLKNLYEED